MSETFQQYRQRILDTLAGEPPAKVRAASAKKFQKLIAGKAPAKLSKPPAPGKWSVAEILAHLADSEVAFSWRIRAIVGNPGCPIPAFDQDAWAQTMNYAKRNPKQSLAAFTAMRENNEALLKSLRKEQFHAYGIHSERGEESIQLLSEMMAGHDINHLRQIESILNSTKNKSKR